MKRRNSPHKKEQEEMTARDLINTDINKMSELEFRITIIRTLSGVENTKESFSVEIKEVKSSQDEIKNAITETQCLMNVLVARMDEAEQRISKIEDKITENSEAGKKKEN